MLNVVFRQDYGAVRKVRLWPVSDRRLKPTRRRSLRDPLETVANVRYRQASGSDLSRGPLRQIHLAQERLKAGFVFDALEQRFPNDFA